jgi:hypothetical protein
VQLFIYFGVSSHDYILKHLTFVAFLLFYYYLALPLLLLFDLFPIFLLIVSIISYQPFILLIVMTVCGVRLMKLWARGINCDEFCSFEFIILSLELR